MYMLGRLRTASRPSRTVIEDAPYAFFAVATCLLVAPVTRSLPGRRMRDRTSPDPVFPGEGRFFGPLKRSGGHDLHGVAGEMTPIDLGGETPPSRPNWIRSTDPFDPSAETSGPIA